MSSHSSLSWVRALPLAALLVGSALAEQQPHEEKREQNLRGQQASRLLSTIATENQQLVASDGAVNDQFGCSVSVSGKVLVVGAAGDDTVRGGNTGKISMGCIFF